MKINIMKEKREKARDLEVDQEAEIEVEIEEINILERQKNILHKNQDHVLIKFNNFE